MEPIKKQNDYTNTFKLETENNDNSAVNNIDTNRNEDFGINSTKRKKKSTKMKGEVNIKTRPNASGIQSSQRIQIKNSDARVKNIIININNNPISNVQASQQIPVKVQNLNNHTNEYEPKKTEPNKLYEMNIDMEANQFKINDKVLDAHQTKFFIYINRLLTSSDWSWVYLICFICCTLVCLISLVDIFAKLYLEYRVWLFILEILFLLMMVVDTIFKLLVMRSEYLKNIVGLMIEILIVTIFFVNLYSFVNSPDSIIFFIFHFVFWGILSVKFLLAYKSLKLLLRHQRDVRQNVEEIINFSEIMDENNQKKSETPAKYLNKIKKFTPAISFIDDEIMKNKKEFNLIKQEENKENLDNN